LPEITRDDFMDDLRSGIAGESSDFGCNTAIPHHVHSTEEKEALILAVIYRGK